jgi:hypothetical protein
LSQERGLLYDCHLMGAVSAPMVCLLARTSGRLAFSTYTYGLSRHKPTP